MKPREFFERLEIECAIYKQDPQQAWEVIPLDEWDWVMDTSQGWKALTCCLADWQSNGCKLDKCNNAPYPAISCLSCNYHSDGNCKKFKKQIPDEFINKGCKDWNS